jgi:hypothetical protein
MVESQLNCLPVYVRYQDPQKLLRHFSKSMNRSITKLPIAVATHTEDRRSVRDSEKAKMSSEITKVKPVRNFLLPDRIPVKAPKQQGLSKLI